MTEKTYAKRIGDMGEKAAGKYLEKKGWKIVGRNYRVKGGEVDIIAENDEYIIFVEVKTRTTYSLERPSYFVDSRKQKKLILTAEQYLEENECDLQPRLDVIEVEYDKNTEIIVHIEHFENAFMQTEDYAPF